MSLDMKIPEAIVFLVLKDATLATFLSAPSLRFKDFTRKLSLSRMCSTQRLVNLGMPLLVTHGGLLHDDQWCFQTFKFSNLHHFLIFYRSVSCKLLDNSQSFGIFVSLKMKMNTYHFLPIIVSRSYWFSNVRFFLQHPLFCNFLGSRMMVVALKPIKRAYFSSKFFKTKHSWYKQEQDI